MIVFYGIIKHKPPYIKTLLLSIFLIISSHCFAQDPARDSVIRDSLKAMVLAKALRAPEYKKAVVNVNLFKSHIKLANEGKMPKATVVKEYNTRLGDHLGQKQSFKDVELKITGSGDDYIKYILLTTEARIATEEAAKKTKKSNLISALLSLLHAF